MNWYLKVLKQYVDFSGRARRKEYWMFVLFNMIFSFAAMIMDNVFGTTFDILPYGVFYCIYGLGVLIPSLAVVVRRLHDVGKSGWMLLLLFIPIVGAIWIFVLMVLEGDLEENNYGPDTKVVVE